MCLIPLQKNIYVSKHTKGVTKHNYCHRNDNIFVMKRGKTLDRTKEHIHIYNSGSTPYSTRDNQAPRRISHGLRGNRCKHLYKPTSFDKDEILANHRSFMTSLNIPSGNESEDLPYLYWIPKLHKTPYKERYI
jgi:hypothetical protein